MRRDIFMALAGAMAGVLVFLVLLTLTSEQAPTQQPPPSTFVDTVSIPSVCEQLPERC